MADETVFELTQENTMTAGMRFPLQETSSSTKATSATYALMGGLEYDTTYDTNADHADYTFVAADLGKIFGVDLSGAALTSEVIFDLPAEANVNVGERIGFYITAGSSTDGEELAIRTAAVGDTINGTDYSASDWSRLFITGELVIFRCINKTTQADWIVEYDGRIPCKCRMDLNGVDDTVTDAAFTVLDLSNAAHDIGDISDAANDGITLRRDGVYRITGQAYPAQAVSTTTTRGIGIYVNGSPNAYYYDRSANTNTTNNGTNIVCGASLSDGDLITLRVSFNFVSTAQIDGGVAYTFLEISEIL